jgi:hypothetical protein
MSTADLFSKLPPDANVWIFVSDRSITGSEAERLLTTTRVFTSSWVAHGRSVRGESAILESRFLIVAGFVDGGSLSGCGIDASFRAVSDVGNHLGIEWMPPLTIAYREHDGIVHTVSRREFRERAASGTIDAQTTVFDTSLSRLGDVRERFEVPVTASWHAQLLPKEVQP